MATKMLTIPYSDELLLSLRKSPEEFETEARLLLAVKLYELNQVSTGGAARLAGMSRVAFMFELARFGLSPLGQEPEELAEDLGDVAAAAHGDVGLAGLRGVVHGLRLPGPALRQLVSLLDHRLAPTPPTPCSCALASSALIASMPGLYAGWSEAQSAPQPGRRQW